ncbi:MmgE/PrpD family protein [Paragemmobacter straminiformis]|uniref:MmgE/PrpD family protein n=1 Tax=Paragemmobacter straminiformis TaxID=2045119 RepID=A0A842I6F0_9RHOB|nr:MmgE/PrpD family protein [Gemmobacter straminiformis]MBC2834528.1 MmgE/PrpD family protein [Gemmobacter straminiformis]
MAPTADISHDFASFAANTRYEDLPEAAVEAAKKSLLDTLGVMLAASGMEPAVRPILETVLENGGQEQATIIGFGKRVPSSQAAFVNGALAHGLDFDSQTPWGAHPDSSVVPTVLALAEKRGGVSGKELIRAIAIGQELFIRLRCNVGWHMDWNLSTAVGCFSATAAGAAVMGLDTPTIARALGIASMQSAGTMEQIFGIGSDLRGMYAGFTSQGCVNAVLLAAKGMTGIDGLFEGEAGLFKVYFKGEYNREAMLKDLGSEFLCGGMTYKYWPAVGNAHTYIHAAIELMRENNVALEDVEKIRVYCGDFAIRMCVPLEKRQVPGTLVDAKFSLPFLVALALTKRQMNISDFTQAALRESAVLMLARKVTPVLDPAFNWNGRLPDGKVEITLTGGRTISRLGSHVPGTPDNPMTWDQIGWKFKDCASAAIHPVDANSASRAIDLVQKLEAQDSSVISALFSTVSGGVA